MCKAIPVKSAVTWWEGSDVVDIEHFWFIDPLETKQRSKSHDSNFAIGTCEQT